MTSALIIISIFVAVAIGYKSKINVGVIAMAFAYIFGSFVLNLKTSEIIAFWPTSLFYFILMVSFFYGIAMTNGTLNLVAENAIYAFRNKPWFIPILLWLISFGISGLGPGPVTVFAFMAPIVMVTADRINMNKIIGTIIVVGGGVAGGYTPISLCYAIVKTNLINAGYEGALLIPYLNRIAFNNIFAQVLIFAIVYIIFKGWKVKVAEDIEKPARFTKKQNSTLGLILLGLVVMVVFPLLTKIIPNSTMISRISKSLEPSLVSTVLLVIALIFKLGDEKKALNFIPFSTIILVCGVGMLVSVAKAAGAVDMFSSWIGSNLSELSVKIITGIVAGSMSFFSSTLGVVAPTLIPMIPNISASTGVGATALVSTIMIAGHFAGVSPFSTGGAMTLAGEKDETKRDKLFIQLMALSLCSIVFASLLIVIGIIR
jgi:di/tricarboxylate transporter